MSSSTLRAAPAKCWTFSWPDAPSDWEAAVESTFGATPAKGWVASATPCAQTQRCSLKGFVVFDKKVRKTALKTPGGMTFKIATRNSPEIVQKRSGEHVVAKGCCLEQLNVASPSASSCPNIVLRPWQEEIQTLLQQEPDDRTIHWIWEPQGCTGKTTFQKWLFHQFPGTVVLSGKAADMKHNVTQYCARNGKLPRNILINVPRCQDTDCLSWQGIEEIKDMFFFSPKYEGGMVCGASPHVLIFSNQAPPKDKLSLDRWQVRRLSEHQLKMEAAPLPESTSREKSHAGRRGRETPMDDYDCD